MSICVRSISQAILIRRGATGILDDFSNLQKALNKSRDELAERERRILVGEQPQPPGFLVTEGQQETDMGAAIAKLVGKRPD